MPISDKEFREAFKPLQIPADYHSAVSEQDKILFALAQLGEGTAADVRNQLIELDPAINNDLLERAESILNSLFEKGLLNGGEKEGDLFYNLSKITEANKGAVDPKLLEPRID